MMLTGPPGYQTVDMLSCVPSQNNGDVVTSKPERTLENMLDVG